MRPAPMNDDDPTARRLRLAGAVLVAGGLFAAGRAIVHMAALKAICGAGPDPHCGWCFAAVALIAAGVTAFTASASRRLRIVRASGVSPQRRG